MDRKLFSEDWTKDYQKVWNNDEELMKSLKSFTATVEFGITGV